MPAPKTIIPAYRQEGDNHVFDFRCVTPGDHEFTESRAEQDPEGKRTIVQMMDDAYEALRPRIESRVAELDSTFADGATVVFVPRTAKTPAKVERVDGAPVETIESLKAIVAEKEAQVAELTKAVEGLLGEKEPPDA